MPVNTAQRFWDPSMETTTPASRGTKPVPYFHFVHDGDQYTVSVSRRCELPLADSTPVRELDRCLDIPEAVFKAQPAKKHSFQLLVERHSRPDNHSLVYSGELHCIVDEYPTYCDVSIEHVRCYEELYTWSRLMVNQEFHPLLVWLEQLLNVPAVQQVVIAIPFEAEYEWNVF